MESASRGSAQAGGGLSRDPIASGAPPAPRREPRSPPPISHRRRLLRKRPYLPFDKLRASGLEH
jgi:hypothetical protein